ncbi:PorT family protein [Salegentibacter sp. LM13S]|uniref:porin family protein n=1 Tax=Salegentibacter lacus TaxID=2873599 RepID=UPI001CCD08C0|nr:PorT family protein [Salegentibacter lacus]
MFTGTTVKAQESVLYGFKAGVNFTNMKSDNFSESNTMTGLNLGLLAEIPLTNRFSLQPEVLYSTNGTDADIIQYGGGPISREYVLEYIKVPVLAKLFLTESLSLEAGPSFNFLVNGKIDGEEEEYGSSFELGGALGASYKFGGGFFGSVRYMQGLTDAFVRENYEYNIYNYGFQLGVGMMF